MAVYFTKVTEQAIIDYNNTEDWITRERLYNKEIYPPFMKMAEILINKFKFYYINHGNIKETQQDVVSFMTEKLSKYNSEKGKAFSYFSIVSRNWLIIENRKAYKEKKSKSFINENSEYYDTTYLNESTEEKEEQVKFFILFLDWVYDNRFKFYPRSKIRAYIIEALVDKLRELIKDREVLENKKLLYRTIRNEFSLPRHGQLLVVTVSRLKYYYKDKYKFYIKHGYFDKEPPKKIINRFNKVITY